MPGRPLPSGLSANAPVVSARYDMDGRDVGTSCLCDRVCPPPLPPFARTSDAAPGNGGAGKSNVVEGAAAPSPNNAMEKTLPRYAVARGDGLHLYSPEEKVGVCPIDGNKIAVCSLPPPPVVCLRRPVRPPLSSDEGAERSDGPIDGAGASYALVATTDSKSGRDAVDI